MVMVIGEFFDDDGNGSDLYEAGVDKESNKEELWILSPPTTYLHTILINLSILMLNLKNLVTQNECQILLLCRV